MIIPTNVLLSGITGSRAYGLARPDSDTDRHGIYAAPTIEFHGLNPPLGRKATITSHEPDVTYHEAGKTVGLLLSCNPTVSEMLWLPAEGYETRTPLGDKLIDIREKFLSAPRVRDAYLGYATQQFKRLVDSGKFPNVPKTRITKHARHLKRLVDQGSELWVTGGLRVQVLRPETYFWFADQVVEDPSHAERCLNRARYLFDTVPTVLSDEPDREAAESWLLDVRDAFYERRKP